MDNIDIVDGNGHIHDIKTLIMEYAKWLNRDLSFQNIDEELSSLESKYTAPNGEVLVAVADNTAIGMVAYHRLSDSTCEMKRLYVKPEYRGRRMGKTLAEEIISRARIAGYKEMVLDTIAPLKPAIGLYRKLGFKECKPYYDNPMPDVLYFKKIL